MLLLATGFVLGTTFVYNTVSAQGSLLAEEERVRADIYNRVAPSVVSIEVDQRVGNSFEPFSTGTGFVIDRNGHIVTNAHVVDEGDRFAINFFDGTILRAQIIGVDFGSDIAVLQVDRPGNELNPVIFADSDAVVVGQNTVAIGSPFGESWTMTSGIVSALDRTIQGLESFLIGAVIQTDASINPGNSGGPLLNLQGEVIGVNSQIISGGANASAGIGFSIPSNLVLRIASELIRFGEVNYSYLGMNAIDMNLDVIEIFGVPNNLRGVVVTTLAAGGPAAQAGLREVGNTVDIIVEVDGNPTPNFSSLAAYIAGNTTPGQTVIFRVLRGGQFIDLPVTMGERPGR